MLEKEILTFLLGMLPITELGAALPLAVGAWGFSAVKAFVWATAGNLLVPFILLPLLDGLTNQIIKCKDSQFGRVVYKYQQLLFERTRKKTWQKYHRWGLWASFFFVAIPLPSTGAWTGSLMVYLFDIKRRPAYAVITIGVVTAGLVVALVTAGVINFF